MAELSNESMDTSVFREKTVFVAQQLHFANVLAGNDPKQRARAMKKLRLYMLKRSSGEFCFTDDDFLRIWKGLFYCMWMSDKPLIQEELSEEISSLVHIFSKYDKGLMFIKGFFSTLINEWYGLDYHRIDKFLMFVRRFLRQSFLYCKKKKWREEVVIGLSEVFGSTILSLEENEKERFDFNLIMHFLDIFLEELAKVGVEKLQPKTLLIFLKPFAANLSGQFDERIQNAIRDKIFYYLIRQSPEGVEFEAKFEAWKKAGFPGSSWKDMVFVGKVNDRVRVAPKNFDPRAGGVNVHVPLLNFDPRQVAELLKEYAENSKMKTLFKKIIEKFQKLANDEYPLAQYIPKSHTNQRKSFSKQIDEAAEDLFHFEEQLRKKNNKRGVKRKNIIQNKNKCKKIKLNNHTHSKDKENSELEDDTLRLDNGVVKKDSKKKVNKNVLRKNGRKKLKSSKVQESAAWTVSEIESSPEQCERKTLTSVEIQKENGLDEPVDKCDSLPFTENFYLNEVVTKSNDIAESNEEVAKINEDVAKSNEEVAKSNEEVAKSNEEVAKSNEEVAHSNEEITKSNEVANDLKKCSEVRDATGITPVIQSLPNQGRIIATPVRRSARRSIKQSSNEDSISDLPSVNDSSMLQVDSQLEKCNEGSSTPKSVEETMETEDSKEVEEAIPELIKISEPLQNQNSPMKTPKLSPLKRRKSLKPSTPGSGKKVNIVLQMNKSQAVSEYFAAVRQSPSVPHDANKKPHKSVLKQTSVQSPINPFYKPPKGVYKM